MTDSPNSHRNTRLHHLYCDASNYKARGVVVLAGALTNNEDPDGSCEAGRFTRLLESLPTNSSGAPVFVPDQVGPPNLRHQLPGRYGDDTNRNVIVAVEPTNDPATHDPAIGDFISACLAIERWDPDIPTDAP